MGGSQEVRIAEFGLRSCGSQVVARPQLAPPILALDSRPSTLDRVSGQDDGKAVLPWLLTFLASGAFFGTPRSIDQIADWDQAQSS